MPMLHTEASIRLLRHLVHLQCGATEICRRLGMRTTRYACGTRLKNRNAFNSFLYIKRVGTSDNYALTVDWQRDSWCCIVLSCSATRSDLLDIVSVLRSIWRIRL